MTVLSSPFDDPDQLREDIETTVLGSGESPGSGDASSPAWRRAWVVARLPAGIPAAD
jgi:hypothetical protein